MCRSPKSPCEDSPCENGGSCSPIGSTDFKCYCDKDFVGLTCTDRVDICDLEQPCGQGSTCLTTTSGPFYKCLCPWNQGGPTCKETLLIGKSVGFNGDGFAGSISSLNLFQLLRLSSKLDQTLIIYVSIHSRQIFITLKNPNQKSGLGDVDRG